MAPRRSSLAPNWRCVFVRRGLPSKEGVPSAVQLASSARFGVATRDRGKVWTCRKSFCKPKVVNEILPTTSCDVPAPHKSRESSGLRESRRNFFHLRDIHRVRPDWGRPVRFSGTLPLREGRKSRSDFRGGARRL